MASRRSFIVLTLCCWLACYHCLELHSFTRRRLIESVAIGTFGTSSISIFAFPLPSLAEGSAEGPTIGSYETRDRKMNKDALIREDYWYMIGKTPPRVLPSPLQGDNPQWNAFGSCESTVKGGGNPCTYVSLNQRIPAYSKYGNSIAYGAKDMVELGRILQKLATQPPDQEALLWEMAAEFVAVQERTVPPPLVDAELKMVLFATAMTTSPNFPLPSRELYVARFYANECHFASGEMASAIASRDLQRALQAWEFGKDSWNSYFQVVNRSITSKVGEPFQRIA